MPKRFLIYPKLEKLFSRLKSGKLYLPFTFYILVFTFLLAPLSPILASPDLNLNYILSDSELFDYNSLNLAEIQEFLDKKGGTLGRYIAIDVDGGKRRASEMIYRAARKYQISPKYLLVLLQKEQSLIENPEPSEYNYRWATGYSRCDSCDPEDPRVAIFGGFAQQIDRAAWRNRYYVEHPKEFRFQIGKEDGVDGYSVTPANQATVNLLNYTPHYHGNYNFGQIWNRYFTRLWPDGSLLQQEGEAGVWLIQNGQKRPILTKTALISRYDPTKIITVTKSDLDKYETGSPIKFADYSLLQSPAGTVYLLVGDKRRGIASGEVMRTIGFNREEVIEVTWQDLDYYPEGKPITVESAYPTGALLQDSKTGGIYFVQEGVKYPIWGKEILKVNFKDKSITAVSPEELKKYSTGDPVKFKDGELITSSGTNSVYVVSQGKKRPIASAKVFKELGYKWGHIIYTSDQILKIHPTGEIIDVNLGE